MKLDFDLDLLRVLVAVAEGGSYAAAARSLDAARATVRRRLAHLEALAGVPLVRREGDVLTPTRWGAALVRGARSLMTEAAMLMAEVTSETAEPSGLVRVAIPPGEPPFLAMMALQAMRARWTNLRLSVIDSAVPHELLTEYADIALTLTEPTPRGPWEAIDLLQLDLQLYASSSYLKRRGPPETLAELAAHDLLFWSPRTAEPPALLGRDGARIQPPARPVFISNNIHTLRGMTAAGAGLCWFPDGGFPTPGEPPGTLQPILADQLGGQLWLRLLLPNAYREVRRARALADALVDLIGGLRR